MDYGCIFRSAAVKAAMRPLGRVHHRPVAGLLAHHGRKYHLPDGYSMPRPLVDPKTARLHQTLVVLYVERVAACVRYVERGGYLEIVEDPESRLAFDKRKLKNAVRNFRKVEAALASPEGDVLLVALLLRFVRPDLVDGQELFADLVSKTVAQGVGISKTFFSN